MQNIELYQYEAERARKSKNREPEVTIIAGEDEFVAVGTSAYVVTLDGLVKKQECASHLYACALISAKLLEVRSRY